MGDRNSLPLEMFILLEEQANHKEIYSKMLGCKCYGEKWSRQRGEKSRGWSFKQEELPEKETFEQSEPAIHVCTVEVAKKRKLRVQLLGQEFALVCLKKSKKAKASGAEWGEKQ